MANTKIIDKAQTPQGPQPAVCPTTDGPFHLGLADPHNWAVLSIASSSQFSFTGPSVVSGTEQDVGITGATKFQMSDGTIGALPGQFSTGELDLAAGATSQVSGPAKINGGIHQVPAYDGQVSLSYAEYLSQAQSSAFATSQCYAAFSSTMGPASINITNPKDNVTVTGSSGMNVLNLTDLILNGGATLTFTGPSDAIFAINDSGRFKLDGKSQIVLGGSVKQYNVLYNVWGSGEDVALTGSSALHGILLVPARKVSLSSGIVYGELIGGSDIAITSGAQVIGQCPCY